MRADLPDGTVTFLFTDIEGSTRLLHDLGAEGYAAALAEHRRLLRAAFAADGGVEVDTQGDAFFVAFPTAVGALAAARRAAEELAAGPIRVRVGIHTGTPHLTDEGYVGVDVHRAARIAAAGHGGQVLVSASTAGLVDRGDLIDLGRHRLKDLAAAERIFQLGDRTFPPLKSLYATNLPIPATPFIGRQAEVAALGGLLGRQEVRVVTLTGPGGTGKSRLALQAAGAAGDAYPDGVWWVELADLREPRLVAETVAGVIGAHDSLARHIGQRRMLLAIDNAEHMLDAVAELATLRSSCPNLRFLVTSRASLRIAGEHEFAVGTMTPEEAAGLFLDRAAATGTVPITDTSAVAAICARLDYLPLAIELAAARSRILAPAELLARLDDRLSLLTGGARDQPARMRTLRATIDWSHDALGADEQALFRRLSIFRTWGIEDAERVVDLELDVLGSLTEQSLVRRDGRRFWMLETIRQYAAERLEAAGETEQYRERHARHYHARAIELERSLGRGMGDALVDAEADVDNIRASIEYLTARGDTRAVLECLSSLANFWDMSGRLLEGYERTVAALEADAAPTTARCRALFAAAFLAGARGDLGAAAELTETGLRLSRELPDPVGEGIGLAQKGYHAAESGDWAYARQFLEASIELFRRHGEHNEAMATTRTLAWVCDELGERAQAIALSEANLKEARSRGDEVMEAITLGAMTTMFLLPAGDLERARRNLEAAMRIWLRIGERTAQALDLGRWVDLLMARGEYERAARLLAASVSTRAELAAGERWVERANDARRRTLRERLGGGRMEALWREGSHLSLDEAVQLATDR